MNFKKNLELISIALFIVYFILLLTGLKEFTIWNQIHFLFEESIFTPHQAMTLFETSHPHAIRFNLMYQLVSLSNKFKFNSNEIFGLLLISLSLFYKFWFIKKSNPKSKEHFLLVLVYLICFDLASLAMNGRLLIPILILPCFYYNFCFTTNLKKKRFPMFLLTLISLLLSSVSSGTFSLVFLTYVGFELISFIKNKFRIDSSLIFPIIIFSLFVEIQYLFLKKNILFAQNDFSILFTHGVGKYLPEMNFYLSTENFLIFFLLATIPAFILLFTRVSEKIILLLCAITVAIVFSLIGLGVFSVCGVTFVSLYVLILSSKVKIF